MELLTEILNALIAGDMPPAAWLILLRLWWLIERLNGRVRELEEEAVPREEVFKLRRKKENVVHE